MPVRDDKCDKIPSMPENVKYIIKKLNNNGYEAFIVGGCVRDELRNVRPKDWDIATSALPSQMKSIFKKTYDTGIKHGTVTIRVNGKCYEATTYRIDGTYNDSRHPSEVMFTEDIVEDLRRRDFTMNAIAYNETRGYVDPFGGMKDIENGIIRAVMEPSERFKEDGLRMLRAVRFSAQTNFIIEPATWGALKENVNLIKNISVERIRDEIVRTLTSDFLEKLPLLWDSGLMELIIPPKISFDIYRSIGIEAFKLSGKDISLILPMLLKDVEKEANALLKGLKFDNKTVKESLILIGAVKSNITPDEYFIRKRMSEIGTDAFFKMLKIKKCLGENVDEVEFIANNIMLRGDCISLKSMKINGDILKALGIKDGRAIGETLKYLFDMILKEPSLNDFETLRNIIKESKL